MKKILFLPYFVFSFFFFSFSLLSLSRYFSFQLFYYDFGIFQRAMWLLSRFQPPVVHHISLGNINILGDHFEPSIVLLAPLFWISSNPIVLLIEQSLAAVVCAYLIYRIGMKMKLSSPLSLFTSIVFLLFAGVENAIITDWHTEMTSGVFLLLFIYFFLFTKRSIWPFIFAFIFLGFKESNAVTLMFVLIAFLLYSRKERKKQLGVLLGATILWFFAVTNIVIPKFSGGSYLYKPVLPSTFQEAVTTLLKPQKMNLVFLSFLSYGFLPILGGVWLLPVLGEFLIRFYPVESSFENFTLAFHHNVYLGIFLSLASLRSLQYMTTKVNNKKYMLAVVGILLIFILFVSRKVTNIPLNLLTNPVFWRELKPRTDLFQAVARVPETGSVAIQNNLFPYVAARKDMMYLLSKNYIYQKPDSIVFDLSSGQNPNNFYPIDQQFLEKEKNKLLKTHRRIDVGNKNFYIFIKK